MLKLIGEKQYDKLMRTVVEPGLEAMREEIELPLPGGGSLHAEIYNRYDAKRAVVMLHGYTESAEKLREMAWYFLSSGYSVFSYDHRGHGQSVREIEDLTVTHVDRFGQYIEDLEVFMDKVVFPRMGDAPLMLYAHSMGGAVGAKAMMAHPGWFARAVLTSPMIAACTGGFPLPVAKGVLALSRKLGRGRARAIVGRDYDPEGERLETSCSTSLARFSYYKEKRMRNLHLRNCSPTNDWLWEALAVTDELLDPANAAKITTPLLLCQALQDDIVKLPEQEQFVSMIPGARLQAFDARHELYLSHDEVMEAYVRAVLGFFAEE